MGALLSHPVSGHCSCTLRASLAPFYQLIPVNFLGMLNSIFFIFNIRSVIIDVATPAHQSCVPVDTPQIVRQLSAVVPKPTPARPQHSGLAGIVRLYGRRPAAKMWRNSGSHSHTPQSLALCRPGGGCLLRGKYTRRSSTRPSCRQLPHVFTVLAVGSCG